MPGASLPASVAETLDRYLLQLDEHAAGALIGLYLVGSVALGDYREDRSDVDVVALLRRPLADAPVAALERVHRAMGGGRPFLDGIYIDAPMLAAPPASPSIVPRSLDGVFDVQATFETNPAVWLCLAHHGVRVRGIEPASLTIAHDPLHLSRFLVGNLQTYWRSWIADCRLALARKQPGEDGNAAALEWGVLGTARIACTLATGRIVSKREAAEWALTVFPTANHSAIHDALAARNGTVSRFPLSRFASALACMEFVIDAAVQRQRYSDPEA